MLIIIKNEIDYKLGRTGAVVSFSDPVETQLIASLRREFVND